MPKGIIISNISNLYNVETEDNKIYKCNARGKFKNSEISPIAGDYVEIDIVDEAKATGVINEIKERNNYTKRPKMANLTQIILVVSMKLPKPDLVLLDKQLAYAEYMKIEPVICLNKIDLVDEQQVKEIKDIYIKIGYTVIETNAKEGKGIKEIAKLLKDNITAFSGNSGVGKSTLINSIFSNEMTKEGMISSKNKRGKNTTTNTYLYKLDSNSYIADTPGFSTFDISEIKSEDLYKYFPELNKYSKDCEFIGCTHIKEENCGIKEAVENGNIAQARYERFCKIYLDLKQKEARKW